MTQGSRIAIDDRWFEWNTKRMIAAWQMGTFQRFHGSGNDRYRSLPFPTVRSSLSPLFFFALPSRAVSATLVPLVSERRPPLWHTFSLDYRDVDWLVDAKVFLSPFCARSTPSLLPPANHLPTSRSPIVVKVLIKSGRRNRSRFHDRE